MSTAGRCCVRYCEGAGVFPIELKKNLHLLLCTLHGREWMAERASANVRSQTAHERWQSWLQEASHRCWQLQSEPRRAINASLEASRAKLRAEQLKRFRLEASALKPLPPLLPARPSTTETLAMASRALRRVARLVRASGYAPRTTFTRLVATLPHRK